MKKISITVSGLSGSGKTYVAKFIAKKLKLKHYSAGELFREFAKNSNKSLEDFCRTREKNIDLIIEKRTKEILKKGNVVIDGRLTSYVATELIKKRKINCFRIYVDCPLKIRAKRVAKRDNIKYEEALKKIKERDKSDLKKYKEIYGINPLSKKFYDVIIDNSKNIKSLNSKLEKMVYVFKAFMKGRI
jgi:cytidylate kinase